MKKVKIAFTAGLAMFSMFFGSGNLVFPIKLGIDNSLTVLPSIIGVLVTGVVVPFMGLYGIILYKGYSGKYFDYIGKSASHLLIFLMLALLGPLGVIPRCITVATSGMQLVLPEIDAVYFNLFFVLTVYYMLVTKVGIVQVLGKFLSPLLIIGLLAIMIAGFFDCPSIGDEVIPLSRFESFRGGILTGYHTMDLMAAFFFGVSIVDFLRKKMVEQDLEKKEILTIAFIASVIGAGLLASVYIGFVYLGGKYSFDLMTIAPERLIVHLAEITLGGVAKPIAAVTIFMACFTTAIVLTQIFCSYIEESLIQKQTRLALQATIIISFIISLFGFDAISEYLSRVLGVMYPGLITIAIMNLITKQNIALKKYSFWCVVLVVLATITFASF